MEEAVPITSYNCAAQSVVRVIAKSMKARRKEVSGIEYVEIICPGCSLRVGFNYFHVIDTNGPIKWKWNGSLDKPTFEPSLLFWYEHRLDEDEEEKKYVDSARCHSFVREGNIQFLSDCGHALAGKTVELPDLEAI
jgi:hypothetical protein